MKGQEPRENNTSKARSYQVCPIGTLDETWGARNDPHHPRSSLSMGTAGSSIREIAIQGLLIVRARDTQFCRWGAFHVHVRTGEIVRRWFVRLVSLFLQQAPVVLPCPSRSSAPPADRRIAGRDAQEPGWQSTFACDQCGRWSWAGRSVGSQAFFESWARRRLQIGGDRRGRRSRVSRQTGRLALRQLPLSAIPPGRPGTDSRLSSSPRTRRSWSDANCPPQNVYIRRPGPTFLCRLTRSDQGWRRLRKYRWSTPTTSRPRRQLR